MADFDLRVSQAVQYISFTDFFGSSRVLLFDIHLSSSIIAPSNEAICTLLFWDIGFIIFNHEFFPTLCFTKQLHPTSHAYLIIGLLPHEFGIRLKEDLALYFS